MNKPHSAGLEKDRKPPEQSASAVNWRDAIHEYLTHLSVERKLSILTQKSYRLSLERFTEESAPPDIEDVRIEHVRDHILRLRELNLSPVSIAQNLSSLRSFFNYQIRHGRLAHNPAQHVKAPKAPKKLPNVLDVDEAVKLVGQSFEGSKALRNRALLELLYSSGIRLSEIVALNVGDIDLRFGQAVVTGKGNKQRVVPIGSHALTALNHWLASREKCSPGDPLFTGRRHARIARRTVQDIVKKAGLKALNDDSVHPHLLRHCFASHMLESSSDLRAVQELLGHESIETTQVYTHIDFQQLSKVYDAAHPRARRK
ncbi:MAG: tyrosine recombinase XerC [Gammaproteobacteria bacterium]|nr:tyrosine recombinase XerC [Gammaproteobacteria bacterium]